LFEQQSLVSIYKKGPQKTFFFLRRIAGIEINDGIFYEAINSSILSGYFYAAKCGNLLGRLELASIITQKVAILQVKIIPTIGGKGKMKH